MWPARSLLGLIALCACSSAPVVDGPCTTNQQCVPEQRCISGVCTSVMEHGCKATPTAPRVSTATSRTAPARPATF